MLSGNNVTYDMGLGGPVVNTVTALDIFQTSDIHKVAKVVHGNRSHSHRNRSDTALHTTTRALLATTLLPSLSRTYTCHALYADVYR